MRSECLTLATYLGSFLDDLLAENTSAVLVHERVKKQVEDAGINTLTWIPPEMWAG